MAVLTDQSGNALLDQKGAQLLDQAGLVRPTPGTRHVTARPGDRTSRAAAPGRYSTARPDNRAYTVPAGQRWLYVRPGDRHSYASDE